MGLLDKPGKSECGRLVKAVLELYAVAHELSRECVIIAPGEVMGREACGKFADAMESVAGMLAKAEELGCTGPAGYLRRDLSEDAARVRRALGVG